MLMRSFRRKIATSPAFHETAGVMAAWYLRFVWRTTRVTIEPPHIYDELEMQAIDAMWHGQNFMTPIIKKRHNHRQPPKELYSRHREGYVNARAGNGLISAPAGAPARTMAAFPTKV